MNTERLREIKPVYVDTIDEDLQDGILYISLPFNCAIHLCACGCQGKVVTPINNHNGWSFSDNSGLVSLHPSIGNWIEEKPNYHAHYYIINNKIIWS